MSEPNTSATHDPFSLDDEGAEEVDTVLDAGGTPLVQSGEDEDDDEDDDDDDDDKADAEADAEAARRAEQDAADLRRADDRRRQGNLDRRRAAAQPPVATEARPDKMLVRVKPFNAKRGQTMRTHSRIHDGARATFAEGKGWYEVSHALAEELRTLRCSDMDPDSNLAFDVCTPREARRIDDREEAATEQETRAPAKRPRSAH